MNSGILLLTLRNVTQFLAKTRATIIVVATLALSTGPLMAINGGAGTESNPYIVTQSDNTMDGGWFKVTSDDYVSGSHRIYVGFSGYGNLSIEPGCAVTDEMFYLGYNPGSEGTLVIHGANAILTNFAETNVGCDGKGTLEVMDGAQVMGNLGFVGLYEKGEGHAWVTGKNSRWIVSAKLSVGEAGTGELKIADGGTIFASSLAIGTKGRIRMRGGYLVIQGEGASNLNRLYELIAGGTALSAYDDAAHDFVAINSGNYKNYVTLEYYSDIKNCRALANSNLSGPCTVLASIDKTSPEQP